MEKKIMPVFHRVKPLFFLIAFCWVSSASASTLLAQNVSELSVKSDLIVQGKVIKTEGVWLGKRIVTKVTLQVDSLLKGSASTEVILYTPGGVANGIGMKVSGAASFSEKEEVLVFLQNNKSSYQVLGLGQGKYQIQINAKKEKIATPQIEGVLLVTRAKDGSLVKATAPTPQKLSALEAQIARALASE